MHCVGEIIKTNNRKHLIIISIFILTLLLSLIIPIKYIQLLSSPLTLILIIYIFKNELKSTNWNSLLRNEVAYENSITAFILALVGQSAINLISIKLMNPITQEPLPLLPILPVYIVFLAPIIEEVLFRRIIFGTLQRNKEKFSVLAAIISSLLFAALHMNIVYFAGYFLVGMVFCYYYFKSESLYTTILAHTYFNFFVLFIQSAHT